MNETQLAINNILNGDEKYIIQGLSDTTPIIKLNSIIEGTRRRIKAESFVNGLFEIASGYNETIFGIPIKYYAISALHILGLKEYIGENIVIKRFIEGKFA